MRPVLRRMPFYAAQLLTMACVLLIFAIASGVRINLTASMPQGLYRILWDDVPRRGDAVAFCLPLERAAWARERGYVGAGVCPAGTQPLLKYLAGLPGDRIDMTADGVRVTPPSGPSCLWPARALARDRNGRALSLALESGVIPDGQALTLAVHPGSLDGRYLGFVPFSSLRRVKPLTESF